MRYENDRFVLECIEVKTTETGDLANDCDEVIHAREQIQTTLEACAAALPDNTWAKTHFQRHAARCSKKSSSAHVGTLSEPRPAGEMV